MENKSVFSILAIFVGLLIGSITAFFLFQKLSENIDITAVEIIVPIAENTEEIVVKNREVIGFLPHWMVSQKARVYPQNLTQLVYFNIEVDSSGNLKKKDKNGYYTAEWNHFVSSHFHELKNQAKLADTKVLVAINNFNIESIDALIASKKATDNFAKQLKNLAVKYDLDGVNIDFEYTTDEILPNEKYFARFLSAIREEMFKENEEFIVSVDFIANSIIKNPQFNLEAIAEIVDQIIIMTYDYHHPGSERAGPVAPIFNDDNDRNVNGIISLLKARIPEEKIVMGIPFYGYEWQTADDSYQSEVLGTSTALASYGRIKKLIETDKSIRVNWNEKARSPWIVYWEDGVTKQIYYEDDRSLTDKITYASQNDLGGIAIWALGYEGDYLEPWQIIKKHLL